MSPFQSAAGGGCSGASVLRGGRRSGDVHRHRGQLPASEGN